MTEIDKRVRLIGPWRVAIVVMACLALLVPVVAAMAASPAPASNGPLAASPAALPAASPKADPSGGTDKKTDANRDRLRSLAQGLGRDFAQGLEKGFAKGGLGQGRGAITITAIDGSKVSLKTVDGWTRTITLTSDTTITKGGQKIAVGDLKVGDTINFREKRADDGSYSIVAIGVPTPQAGGEVTAVGANSLTIKLRDGSSKTITLTGTTGYTLGGKAGSKSNVTVGTSVNIEGTTSGTTFTALTVHVRLAEVAGEVTAKGTNSLTVKRRDGTTITIHVSSTTTYFGKGKGKAATLADIAVGDHVGVSGTKRTDGSIDAVGVLGRGAKVLNPVKPEKPTSTPAAG